MKIGVVSPYPISRKGLCALLDSIPEIEIALDVDNPLDHFEDIRRKSPAILLFDLHNPALDIRIIVRTRKLFPHLKILILSGCVDEELELRAIKAGAHGCVSKEAEPQLLARALVAVGRGEMWMSQRISSRIVEEFVVSRDKSTAGVTCNGTETHGLSRREWEILTLVAKGYRNKQVAVELSICESTIKSHLYATFRKLQVSSRLEAILYYYQHLREEASPAAFLESYGSLSQNPTYRPETPEGSTLPQLP